MGRRRTPPLALLLGVLVAIAGLAGCGMFQVAQPLAPGTRDCLGVPIAKCQALLADFARGRPVTATAFRIRCTVASCTESAGSVDGTIAWSDGSSESVGSSWSELP